MHHGTCVTCVTHVPWCMPRSLTSGFLWSQWRVKRSQHSRRMRNAQFYVTGKRPIVMTVRLPTMGWVACVSAAVESMSVPLQKNPESPINLLLLWGNKESSIQGAQCLIWSNLIPGDSFVFPIVWEHTQLSTGLGEEWIIVRKIAMNLIISIEWILRPDQIVAENHYSDVILSVMAPQITGVSIVCSAVCLGTDQGRTMLSYDDVIMSWWADAKPLHEPMITQVNDVCVHPYVIMC